MKFLYSTKLSRVTDQQIKTLFNKSKKYIKHLQNVTEQHGYQLPESSLRCCTDKKVFKTVLDLKSKLVTKKLKYIFLVGIGGSNLGTKAVYDALSGSSEFIGDVQPQIIFLDTNNPVILVYIKKLFDRVGDEQEIIVNIISKSGATTEVIANAEFILHECTKKFGKNFDRVVVTTEPDSVLWHAASMHGYSLLIHEQVGGRFSVLSAVGLFPLMCAGIDVKSLMRGAEHVRTSCLSLRLKENAAFVSAATLYIHNKKSKNIHDTFIFDTQLESCGKWYRQLMGESIGKEHNIHGKKVHAGITPTVSVGSIDLHSVGQLYLGGPHDKITTFISAAHRSAVKIPSQRFFPEIVPDISHKSMSDIMNAILEGVKIAYTKRKNPFMEIILNEISAYELGELLQFKMLEIIYLGYLFEINAFDQPHVELYKKETRRILSL